MLSEAKHLSRRILRSFAVCAAQDDVMIALLLAFTLRIDTRHVLARFDPQRALGATIDVKERGETAKIFNPENVRAMLSAGLKPLAYRLATELGCEAWHWNPNGTFSDAARQEGYWTSSTEAQNPITVSYGYRLPRRGNTRDQAHDDGYSRIDDGDLTTFWKSNPYLGDRPQWVMIDLGQSHPVDSIDIRWGNPSATEYSIQVWNGHDPINEPNEGAWIEFQKGTARYLRIWMTRSSHTGGNDWRDRVGFAINEIFVRYGTRDWIRHAADHAAQTVIWVSSTDPWHRAIDMDESMEQPGLDAIFGGGLTRGLPMLTPVSLLYGTPDDAAAEIAYLRKRGDKVEQVELGEEPDGQIVSPEDYAELFMQWAEAIHRVDPSLHLGGPSFQSTRNVIAFWPDARGRTSWIGRFVDVLRARGRLGDFAFFSFEWYPFDNVCRSPAEQLKEAPRILDRVLGAWRAEGVPRGIPWIASEYGWSSYAAEAEVDLPGALFDAEFVADFLSRGGSAAYLYGYEPKAVFSEKCNNYGALTLFLADGSKLPAYYAVQLVMHEWLQPGGMHELHLVRGTPPLVRAYAVKRPDTTWALLLLNVGRASARLKTDGLKPVLHVAVLHVVQYSPRQYEWHAAGDDGHPTRNLEPRRFDARGSIELPPYSITVITPSAESSLLSRYRPTR